MTTPFNLIEIEEFSTGIYIKWMSDGTRQWRSAGFTGRWNNNTFAGGGIPEPILESIRDGEFDVTAADRQVALVGRIVSYQRFSDIWAVLATVIEVFDDKGRSHPVFRFFCLKCKNQNHEKSDLLNLILCIEGYRQRHRQYPIFTPDNSTIKTDPKQFYPSEPPNNTSAKYESALNQPKDQNLPQVYQSDVCQNSRQMFNLASALADSQNRALSWAYNVKYVCERNSFVVIQMAEGYALRAQEVRDLIDRNKERRPQQERPQPCMAAPPPAATSLKYLFLLLGFLMTAAVGLLLLNYIAPNISQKLSFPVKTLLFTLAICITPTIAKKIAQEKNRLIHVVSETFVFTVILLFFSLWIFGFSAFGTWILYATLSILVIEIGGNFIAWHEEKTYNRLARSALFTHARASFKSFREMFREELALYIPVPVGMCLGLFFGLFRNQEPIKILTYCLQLILILSSCVLFLFLVKAALRMSQPLFRTATENSTRLVKQKWPNEENKPISSLRDLSEAFTIVSPPPDSNSEEQLNQEIELALMSRDLRRIYLYDAIHNITLLIAFVVFFLDLSNFLVNQKILVIGLLFTVFVLIHLPYAIGQSMLRSEIADRYNGIRREEVLDTVGKYISLFPKADFLAAIFMPGTAGGILILLFNSFLENSIK